MNDDDSRLVFEEVESLKVKYTGGYNLGAMMVK